MNHYQIYQDMKSRTKGEIYIGVVGPVRTGKSTFIRRFMEALVLGQSDTATEKELKDQLPVSGSGRMITTVEPKFIPKEAVSVNFGEDARAKIRLIDCVGFLVPDAVGNMEDGRERMVKTPWFEQEIPFSQAAEMGTRKVIGEHSTFGLVITSDGSFGELGKEQFADALEKTVAELKKQGKPFLILVNSTKPYSQETLQFCETLHSTYQVGVMSVSCEQLGREEALKILEKMLYEFPVRQLEFYIPKWVEMLSLEDDLKKRILTQIAQSMEGLKSIRDVYEKPIKLTGEEIQDTVLEQAELSTGIIRYRIQIKEACYYAMLSRMTGVSMDSEYELISVMKEFSAMKEEYVKVQAALQSVRGCGYGVVMPELSEITMEEPQVIRQGNKYGVKMKAQSPSIHMIKANVETEIAPIVGTQQQAEDLISYIKDSENRGESIWETNIFGKSIEQLVEDGIRGKIAQISEESQGKLQDTMKKIVNDSKGGMVCIII